LQRQLCAELQTENDFLHFRGRSHEILKVCLKGLSMSLRLDRWGFTSHNFYNYQLVIGFKKLSLRDIVPDYAKPGS
jgi:hypothetical protein